MPSRLLGIRWDLALHRLHQVIFLRTLAVFTTVNTALQVPGFPAGTTDEWQLNSSSAILNLPAGSSVLYAELVWAGTFRTDTEDVLPFLNDNITFTTPAGTFSVTPDPATAQQGSVGKPVLLCSLCQCNESC